MVVSLSRGMAVLGGKSPETSCPLLLHLDWKYARYIAPDVRRYVFEEYLHVVDAASIWDSFGASAV